MGWFTYRVNLAHGGLEGRQERRQHDGSESQGRLAIVAQGQQVLGRKRTGVDDDFGAGILRLDGGDFLGAVDGRILFGYKIRVGSIGVGVGVDFGVGRRAAHRFNGGHDDNKMESRVRASDMCMRLEGTI